MAAVPWFPVHVPSAKMAVLVAAGWTLRPANRVGTSVLCWAGQDRVCSNTKGATPWISPLELYSSTKQLYHALLLVALVGFTGDPRH